MVKLPEAIQRQVDEAEVLERQLYAPAETPVEQQGAEPAAVNETLPVEQAENPSESTVVTEQPKLQAKAGREDDLSYWRDRANALYGMNQQQAEELRTMRHNFAQLTETVNTLRSQAQQRVEPAPQSNDNDAETFGEDLVTAIDRRAEQKARTLVTQEMQQLQAYVKQLEAKLGNVGEQVALSAQDRFVGRLASLVPDYEAVNAEQGFLNWLGEVDPVYGVPRQVALDNAADANDADRVAAIFNAYKVLTSKHIQQQQKQQVRQELERQTTPTVTRGAAQPTQGKVWTIKDYEQALDPRNITLMGRQKADELAAEAEQAYAEGRIQF